MTAISSEQVSETQLRLACAASLDCSGPVRWWLCNSPNAACQVSKEISFLLTTGLFGAMIPTALLGIEQGGVPEGGLGVTGELQQGRQGKHRLCSEPAVSRRMGKAAVWPRHSSEEDPF